MAHTIEAILCNKARVDGAPSVAAVRQLGAIVELAPKQAAREVAPLEMLGELLRASPSDFAGAFAQIHAKHLEVGGAVAEAAAAKRHGEWEKATATAALDEALALAAARPPSPRRAAGRLGSSRRSAGCRSRAPWRSSTTSGPGSPRRRARS